MDTPETEYNYWSTCGAKNILIIVLVTRYVTLHQQDTACKAWDSRLLFVPLSSEAKCRVTLRCLDSIIFTTSSSFLHIRYWAQQKKFKCPQFNLCPTFPTIQTTKWLAINQMPLAIGQEWAHASISLHYHKIVHCLQGFQTHVSCLRLSAAS